MYYKTPSSVRARIDFREGKQISNQQQNNNNNNNNKTNNNNKKGGGGGQSCLADVTHRAYNRGHNLTETRIAYGHLHVEEKKRKKVTSTQSVSDFKKLKSSVRSKHLKRNTKVLFFLHKSNKYHQRSPPVPVPAPLQAPWGELWPFLSLYLPRYKPHEEDCGELKNVENCDPSCAGTCPATSSMGRILTLPVPVPALLQAPWGEFWPFLWLYLPRYKPHRENIVTFPVSVPAPLQAPWGVFWPFLCLYLPCYNPHGKNSDPSCACTCLTTSPVWRIVTLPVTVPAPLQAP